jgi:3-isopropylmalate dehydrogenase
VHLVRQPERFDVVVTENQHGDILSDLCAALVGGLGFAPSANLGAHRGMFEPSHGTAPDIAGKALANPVATILTGALMLSWLAAEHGDARLAVAAERIEGATARVLTAGRMRTADIGGTATTSAMGDAIAEAL